MLTSSVSGGLCFYLAYWYFTGSLGFFVVSTEMLLLCDILVTFESFVFYI